MKPPQAPGSLLDWIWISLPGEHLTDAAVTMQQRPSFPHTLVMGYSNGVGVRHVGPPGEKKRGGSELGVSLAGTDGCGSLLAETALRLLEKLQAKSLAR